MHLLVKSVRETRLRFPFATFLVGGIVPILGLGVSTLSTPHSKALLCTRLFPGKFDAMILPQLLGKLANCRPIALEIRTDTSPSRDPLLLTVLPKVAKRLNRLGIYVVDKTGW